MTLQDRQRDADIQAGPMHLFRQHAPLLVDPLDGGALEVGDDGIKAVSGRIIPLNDGIPNLFVPSDAVGRASVADVTEMVKAFYEETPFPNYEGMDSRDSLADKARKGVFAALLDEQLPDGALVLEAGCGTGQLSNFLGMSWRRQVFAGDMCLNSLRLGKQFADRFGIRNTGFLQMNIFRPPFRDASFDVVISNGVLHHTGDCEGAFRTLVQKLRPGGYFFVGLYNLYARLPTLWKRRILDRVGRHAYFLDHRLAQWDEEPDKTRAWFMDQYKHPHETRHSMDEVLQWFDRYGLDFVNAIPHIDGTSFVDDEQLLATHPTGNVLSRITTQLGMLLAGGKDGGLFIMIGRRR